MASSSEIFDQLSEKFAALAANNPAAEIEKNVKAMMGSAFEKLDLARREELEVLRDMLDRALTRIDTLEQRLDQLDASAESQPAAPK